MTPFWFQVSTVYILDIKMRTGAIVFLMMELADDRSQDENSRLSEPAGPHFLMLPLEEHLVSIFRFKYGSIGTKYSNHHDIHRCWQPLYYLIFCCW